jgi:hypothetical protein
MAAALWVFGCAGTHYIESTAEAEAKAVAMANEKCMREFGREPFRTGYFPVSREGSRWLWGWLDPAGGQGYTAQVSFLADGSKPEVALSFAEPFHVDMEEPNAPRLNDPVPSPVSASQVDE